MRAGGAGREEIGIKIGSEIKTKSKTKSKIKIKIEIKIEITIGLRKRELDKAIEAEGSQASGLGAIVEEGE